MSKSRTSRRSNSDELHEVKGLLPLRWQRKGSRIALDTDRAASSLFQLKGLLLTNEVRDFLQSLTRLNSRLSPTARPSESRTAFISSLIGDLFRAAQPDFIVRESNRLRYIEPKDSLTRDYQKDIIQNFLKWTEGILKDVASTSTEDNRSLSELKRRLNQELLDATTQASKKLQDEVAGFEKTYKVDISILDTITLFICPDCKTLLRSGKFRQVECRHCGKKALRPSELEQIPVSTLSKSISEIIDNNIWLEEGTGWAFRREYFEVSVGYNLIGGSGVWHEIDVIAKKSKAKCRILAECKARALGIGDVFILAGKMRDIGVSSGVLCSTEAEANSEVSRLGKTSGIIVGYDILDKPREFWQSLLEKAI